MLCWRLAGSLNEAPNGARQRLAAQLPPVRWTRLLGGTDIFKGSRKQNTLLMLINRFWQFLNESRNMLGHRFPIRINSLCVAG